MMEVTASARLTLLTRVGFATRGLLYLVIGFLVIGTGHNTDVSGALEYVGDGGGRVLMTVMAAGLIAYGIWRLADAGFDIERHGSDRKGMAERVGAGISGGIHLFLAWQAVSLIRGLGSSGDGTEEGARATLALPGGGAMVMVAGLLLACFGIVQLAKAWRAKFLRYLEPGVAGKPWARWTGQAGYAARGLVFVASGGFLVKAGYLEKASEVRGMEQVLAWLTYPADLAIAAGLFCFGIFSLVEARFRVLHDVPVDTMVRRATGG